MSEFEDIHVDSTYTSYDHNTNQVIISFFRHDSEGNRHRVGTYSYDSLKILGKTIMAMDAAGNKMMEQIKENKHAEMQDDDYLPGTSSSGRSKRIHRSSKSIDIDGKGLKGKIIGVGKADVNDLSDEDVENMINEITDSIQQEIDKDEEEEEEDNDES